LIFRSITTFILEFSEKDYTFTSKEKLIANLDKENCTEIFNKLKKERNKD
jgi:hypothetical protein